MAFADNLRQLPSVQHLAALELRDAQGRLLATIPNQPGKAGSLAVYAALADRHGDRLDARAAQEGLNLFAEHTETARAHPGSHPNIDRLLALVAEDGVLWVHRVAA